MPPLKGSYSLGNSGDSRYSVPAAVLRLAAPPTARNRFTPDRFTAAMMARWPAACSSVTSSPPAVMRPGLKAEITTSWPLSAAASASTSWMSMALAVTPAVLGAASGLRTRAVTWWPRESASSRILAPTKPVAPISATFIPLPLRARRGPSWH